MTLPRNRIIKKSLFSSMVSGPLPLFVLAHFSHHLIMALAVPLMPFIRNDFGLDYTQSGLLISAFTLSYGLSQLPAGRLADYLSSSLIMTIGISGVALSGLLFGCSQTYSAMVLALILMGVMGGGYHPTAPVLISNSTAPKNHGRALGIHLMGGSFSYFLAPLIGVAVANIWGWRGSFIGLSIPIILFGVLLYVLLRQRNKAKYYQDSEVICHDQPLYHSGWFRHLLMLLFLSTFIQAVIFSTIAFIPLFLVDRFGIREEIAAALFSLIYFAGFWGGPLGGYLSDRLGKISVIVAASFICGPVIYLINIVPYGLAFSVLMLLIGTVMCMRGPATEAYIVSQTPEAKRSTILGLYYFSGHEGGGVLTPVIGYLIDKLGFYSGLTLIASTSIIVTLACSIFLRSGKKRPE
jgi:predicted MFS family arabinose efflux permease